jgi:hypothetical protein
VHRNTALLALDLGLSPGVPKEDGTKRPDGPWKRLQTAPASRQEVIDWYLEGRTGNGLFTGYGQLECLEFDDFATYERFREAAIVFGLGSLIDRIESGYCESTPGGGVHWLYRCSRIEGNTKLAERPDGSCADPRRRKPLIETRGVGGWVVIAPSNGAVHPTGGAYTLKSGGLASIATIEPDEREALFSLARSFDEMPLRPPPPPKEAKDPPANGYRSGRRVGDDYNDRARIADIIEPFGWALVHTAGAVQYWRRPGKDRGWSATWGVTKGFRVFTTSTSLEAKSHTPFNVYCRLHHNGDWRSCVKDLAQQGYGTWIDEGGQERPNPAPGRRRKPAEAGPSANGEAEADGGPAGDHYITTEAGVPRSCVTNAMRWLQRRGPRLEYDTFRDRILVDGEPLSDEHIIRLVSAMEIEWDAVVNKVHVDDALRTLARGNPFSSLEGYLRGLQWDGVNRLELFFIDHYEVADTPYHREVGRILFLSAVARGLNPGCKADVVALMIGRQGSGKSDTIAALCPDREWFTDEVGNIGADRAGENLRGKWLVELAELSRVNQGTLEAVKKFITCQSDRYKVPYEREPRDFPRTNIFIGSTNDDTPLRDAENRRVMPVRVPPRGPAEKAKAIEAIEAVRDQLWAEAVHRYEAGEKWWTTDSDVGTKIVEEVGTARREDPWEAILAEMLQFVDETSIRDVASRLGVTTDRLDRKAEMRIQAALVEIGFERKRYPYPPRAWYYARVLSQP